jgi:hypothetical protein
MTSPKPLRRSAIPREWRNRLTAASRINAALDKILVDLSR